MRKWVVSVVVVTAIAMTAGLAAQTTMPAAPPAAGARQGLTLSTPAFDDGGIIPNKYTAAAAPAAPISPPLAWTYPPEGTASFVLIVRDPDQPLNRHTAGPLHWLMFNIPATATGMPEGIPAQAQLPDGSIQLHSQGNQVGPVGYKAPGADAPGPYHHYSFQLYALDIKLALGPDATAAEVDAAVQGHVLGKATLIGRFHR